MLLVVCEVSVGDTGRFERVRIKVIDWMRKGQVDGAGMESIYLQQVLSLPSRNQRMDARTGIRQASSQVTGALEPKKRRYQVHRRRAKPVSNPAASNHGEASAFSDQSRRPCHNDLQRPRCAPQSGRRPTASRGTAVSLDGGSHKTFCWRWCWG